MNTRSTAIAFAIAFAVFSKASFAGVNQEAVITAVDRANYSIEVETGSGRSKRYTVTGNTRIEVDGKLSSFDALTIGQEVQLKPLTQKKTKIQGEVVDVDTQQRALLVKEAGSAAFRTVKLGNNSRISGDAKALEQIEIGQRVTLIYR